MRSWRGSLECCCLHMCLGMGWGRASKCTVGSSPWDACGCHRPTSHTQTDYTRISGRRQCRIETTASRFSEIFLPVCYPKNFVHNTTLDNVIKGIHCPLYLCLPPQRHAVLGMWIERMGALNRLVFPSLLQDWAKEQRHGFVEILKAGWPQCPSVCHVVLDIWWGKPLLISHDLPWATKSSLNIIIIWKADWTRD